MKITSQDIFQIISNPKFLKQIEKNEATNFLVLIYNKNNINKKLLSTTMEVLKKKFKYKNIVDYDKNELDFMKNRKEDLYYIVLDKNFNILLEDNKYRTK